MNSPLFQPFALPNLTLPNRIVMAPMTRSFSPGGVPGDNVADYYRKRAEGGVGLIITEGTGIDRPGSVNDSAVPRFHGDEALAGWAEVVTAVHGAGGKIAPQLWHVGSAPNPAARDETHAESPSGQFKPGKPWGKTMTTADIDETIAAYANAARAALALGFDAVELHGAHGYLIDQFFWDGTNQRTDEWGGPTLSQRSRFALEIVKAVKAELSNEIPLILRVSQWKQQDYTARLATSQAELEAWLAPMVAAGVDVLHCSQRRFWEPEFPELDGEDGLNFAGWTRKVTGAPTITVGSVGLSGEFIAGFGGEASQPADFSALEARLAAEEFDLVAVGRALIVDADWALKVQDGRAAELNGFERSALATLA
ncbi:12-oxophytodienoate reductase [Polymorphobacter multimanifer]|uniref:2,4-dienoyl-CoA reductase-like NADH-dependent reductase (Old Yellow Enzyme family) n=1 Tax=Polymorphobacter multimanifer TaxID=1070431 RepID=A0A841LB62_9SPHN|nr:NADH:flavin oxidoreductase [Polymorphobacter multimanifer]MBB6226248.1 2,4-dienoyl-CoA reductase-like NADH-dependent reductase (Old Yellow Enzyme family) [Polymorphobacter multimanifer]GGI81962.1 12-oxophytodienoate reductase [Polymorphobacter multimanifer]